jgi:hypothetical protein
VIGVANDFRESLPFAGSARALQRALPVPGSFL